MLGLFVSCSFFLSSWAHLSFQDFSGFRIRSFRCCNSSFRCSCAESVNYLSAPYPYMGSSSAGGLFPYLRAPPTSSSSAGRFLSRYPNSTASCLRLFECWYCDDRLLEIFTRKCFLLSLRLVSMRRRLVTFFYGTSRDNYILPT